MGLIKRILSLFPSYKWCGCKESMGTDSAYQFRVKARLEDTQENLFQVREKRTCTHCSDENIDVLVEDTCTYDPNTDIHERKVGVDDNDMVNYGFMDQDEMARMLIEMRLSHSLEPDLDEV